MPKEKLKDKNNSGNKIVEILDYVILVVIVIAVSVPVLLQFLTKETLLLILMFYF
ncbi:hypothetical protein M1N67_01875 [Peptococcaceae bacterium]|nr:hypothetical protein [Peptococcaceae bacterium]